YSVILLAGMTAGAEVPQGIFFNRERASGCAGATATVRVRITEAVQERPHRFAAWLDHRREVHAERVELRSRSRATGCAGTPMTFAAPPPIRVTGCAGSTMGAISGPGAPVATGTGFHTIQRIAVHRQLRIALGRTYDVNITPEQRTAAQRALADPEIYEA